jgi:flagellin
MNQVSASIGVNSYLNQQEVKRATLLKEMAYATTQSSIANALAVPLETDINNLPVVQQNVAIAGNVLSTSQGALSSVSSNLMKMLSTASQALSAPPEVQDVLAQQFNALAQQTTGYVANASVNGINLVSTGASAMTVNTTTEGGQITVNNQPSDAASLGVTATGSSGWSNTSAIQTSISQVQSALDQITSTEASFAASQSALQFASQVNQASQLSATQSEAALSGVDIAATAASVSSSQTQSDFAVAASAAENKLNESVLKLFKNH